MSVAKRDMITVKLKRNLFGRWVIIDADNEMRAWSGSRWVSVDAFGMALGLVQVSNLDNEEEAREYAELFDFAVAK